MLIKMKILNVSLFLTQKGTLLKIYIILYYILLLSAVLWNNNHRFVITTNEIGLCFVINEEAFINVILCNISKNVKQKVDEERNKKW